LNLHLFDEALRGVRETYRLEKRYIHKNGAIIWVRLNVSMVKDGRGRPLYCVSQIEDVTHDILANEKLMISEANLRATINNASVLIWSVDKDYNLLTFNDPFFEYTKKTLWRRATHRTKDPGEPSIDDHKGMVHKWSDFYRRALTAKLSSTRRSGSARTFTTR